MKKVFYISLVVFAFAACKSEPVENTPETNNTPLTDVEDQTTTFGDDTFSQSDDQALLDELNICEMVDSLPAIANCTPENFKIIPISDEIPTKDAFILQAKAGIALKGADRPLPPVRHIFIYARENGRLVQTNGFRGDLIATSKGEKGKDIVLALYLKEDETLFHCLYKWNGDQYSFESIEGLDWGEGVKTLKEDTKDSVSNDIYNAIMSSNLVF